MLKRSWLKIWSTHSISSGQEKTMGFWQPLFRFVSIKSPCKKLSRIYLLFRVGLQKKFSHSPFFDDFLYIVQLKSPPSYQFQGAAAREWASCTRELPEKLLFHEYEMIWIRSTAYFKVFYKTRPKPAYGRQSLDWIVGPGYSFVVLSTNKTIETNQKP